MTTEEIVTLYKLVERHGVVTRDAILFRNPFQPHWRATLNFGKWTATIYAFRDHRKFVLDLYEEQAYILTLKMPVDFTEHHANIYTTRHLKLDHDGELFKEIVEELSVTIDKYDYA